MRPHVLVELGTHTGNSFSGFCQAVATEKLGTRCYAVDTWGGDAQAGYYGDNVYDELAPYIEATYGGFARLLRMTFDEALGQFEDGSIDLLHIDGLHSYEAVRHDFDTWKCKLSPRGVVLFHDTCVLDRGFGVHRLWSELRMQHPGFEFRHSHGLGVLLVGSDVAPALSEFIELATDDPEPIQALFERTSLAGLTDKAIAYQRRFASLAYDEDVGFDCELFLDRGKGFNENEKLISPLKLEGFRGVLRFDLSRFSSGLSRVRFDPGNDAIALDSVLARWQCGVGEWHILRVSGSSAFSIEEGLWLFGEDPWVEFVLPHPVDTIEIEVQVRAMGMGLVGVMGERLQVIQDLRAELDASRSAISCLKMELETHRKAKKELWDVAAKKDQELAALRQAVDDLKGDVEVHRKAEKELWGVAATKDQELAALRQTVDDLKGDVEVHRKAEKELWGVAATKGQELAALRQTVDDLKGDVEVHRKAEKELWDVVATKDRELVVLRQAVDHPLYKLLAGLKFLPRLPLNKS